jgi:hypothetical protein
MHLSNPSNLILGTFMAFGLACGAATAGWVESGDAPEGVPGHQVTVGVGALTSISGVLNRPGGDHTDTYCIRVTDVSLFYATTKIFFGGSATNQGGLNEDTRLWLWDMNGNVLLGNDDVNSAGLGGDTLASFLSDPSTFGAFTLGELVNPSAAGVALAAGTTYLLSISEFSNDPDDAAGVDQVNLGSDFDALHGKNVASGAFHHWENAADTDIITYNIALQGAEYCLVPAPGALALVGLAGLAGGRRRRRA